MPFESMEVQTSGQKVHLRNLTPCPFSYDVTGLGELSGPFCDITKGSGDSIVAKGKHGKSKRLHLIFKNPQTTTINHSRCVSPARLSGCVTSRSSFSRSALGRPARRGAALGDDSCVYKGPTVACVPTLFLPQTASQPLLSGDNRAGGEGH